MLWVTRDLGKCWIIVRFHSFAFSHWYILQGMTFPPRWPKAGGALLSWPTEIFSEESQHWNHAQCDGEKSLDAASRLKIVAAHTSKANAHSHTSRSNITFEEEPLAASSFCCSCEDATERMEKKRISGRGACEIAADANQRHIMMLSANEQINK